jgi:hypothetical protein
MDSSVVRPNFSNSVNNRYGVHYIELASENGVSYESNIGQFFVSYITPSIDTSKVYDTTVPKSNAQNVINVQDPNKLGITQVTSSNYVTITVPKYLFYVTGVTVSHPTEGSTPVATVIRKIYPKGTKFLAVNANGIFNDLKIIGVVENG